MVQAPLIRFTPNLGFAARQQRIDSGDGAGAVEARQDFSNNRAMEWQWYPVCAHGAGGTS